MKHHVFLLALFFPFSVFSAMRVTKQQFDTTKMLTSQQVTINLDAYMTYINQFSCSNPDILDVSKISKDIEMIKIKYSQGTSVQTIINELSNLPCPLKVGGRIVLVENKK